MPGQAIKVRSTDGGEFDCYLNVPVSGDKARFARCEFKPVEVDAGAMTLDAATARKRLDL